MSKFCIQHTLHGFFFLLTVRSSHKATLLYFFISMSEGGETQKLRDKERAVEVEHERLLAKENKLEADRVPSNDPRYDHA